jgi:acetyl esterase/lipase
MWSCHRVLTAIFYLSNPDNRQVSAAYKAFEYLYDRYPPFRPLSATPSRSELIKMRRDTTFAPFIPVHQQCRTQKCVYHFENRSVVTYWISPHVIHKKDLLKQPFVFYLHGGAYVLGDIQGYLGFESQLSNLLHLPICHIEYSLGPENPLPNALEDVIAVYSHFLVENPFVAAQMVVMGDSAGGGLSLLLIQALIRLNIQIPIAVIVVSPWSDLSVTGDSCDLAEVNENLQLVRALRKQAFGGIDEPTQEKIKLFSPLFGSFAGFPPMYIATGHRHRLNNDSDRLATKASEQHVPVIFDKGMNLMHIFPIFFQYYPEGQESIQNICRWIHEQLSSAKTI